MTFTGVGGHAAIAAASDKLLATDAEADELRTHGMSPRQMELDRRWAYYRTRQYDACKVAWDGSRVVGQSERDSISLAGFVPPGFYVANSETLPIHFRKPSSPYHLAKVIVDRFTSLLFGQKRHPRVEVKGDPATEDFVNAVIEVGRLWPQMMLARTYGGAIGTAVVGFKLVDGRPSFEVFDPRWCTPKFLDRATLTLQSVDYRYKYKQEVRDPETGGWVDVEFWYRRVVNTDHDVVYEPCRADPKIPPRWVPAQVVKHQLGFCPVVWIQNEPNLEEVDGDGDCQGIYDKCDSIDKLLAQSDKGVLANCDPSVVIACNATMDDVKKGSNFALKLPSGGTANYMEMTGTGIIQAREQASLHRDHALEVTCCVIEQPNGAGVPKTATEVDRSYAAMLARADKFREQYGETGIKKLVNMVIATALLMDKPRVVGGQIQRYEVRLPPRDDGRPRKLGSGPYAVTLTWPHYFEPSPDDALKAVNASGTAKQLGLIDQQHATKYVAPFFQVEDATKLADELVAADQGKQDSLDQLSLSGAEPDDAIVASPAPNSPTTTGPDAPEPEKPADTAFNGAQVAALADVVMNVTAGKLPVEAAREIIMVAFPVTPDQASRMLAGLAGRKPAAVASVAAPAAPAESPAPPPGSPQ